MTDHSIEFFKFIRSKDAANVEKAVAADPSLRDAYDPVGMTPLFVAAEIGALEIVEILLAAGHSVDRLARDYNRSDSNETAGPRLQIIQTSTPVPFATALAEATQHEPLAEQAVALGIVDALSALSESGSSDSERHTTLSSDDEDRLHELEDDEDDVEYLDDCEDDIAEWHGLPIQAAAYNGHLEIVKRLAEVGAALRPRWSCDGAPPLQCAAAGGHLELVEWLIGQGCSLTHLSGCVLEHAARGGSVTVLRYLEEAGQSLVDWRGEDHTTLLMEAAFTGQLDAVRFLLGRGVDPKLWSQGEQAVDLAARGGHREVVEELIPISNGRTEQEVLEELEHGCRRNDRLQDHGAERFVSDALNGKIDRVRGALADGRIDVDAICSDGLTALNSAVSTGHLDVIRALLDAGANVEIGWEDDGDSHEGETPLMNAAGGFWLTGKRTEIMDMLLDAGADLEKRDAVGATALHYAVDSGYLDAIDCLLERGADIDAKDDEGRTSLMRVGFLSPVRKHLLAARASEAGMENVALIDAAKSGDLEAVRSLLAQGADPNHRNAGTALSSAAARGDIDMVQVLLAAGSDPNRRESEGYFSPLLQAAYAAEVHVARLLIEAGADPHIELGGMTPLDYVEQGRREGYHPEAPWHEMVALLERLGGRRAIS